MNATGLLTAFVEMFAPRALVTSIDDETPVDIAGTYVYRTRDGRAWFRFSNVPGDGGLRVYVVSQPPYGNRSTDTHTIHRIRDGEHFFICFNGRIACPGEAMAVAGKWSECTWRYIETGRFEEPQP